VGSESSLLKALPAHQMRLIESNWFWTFVSEQCHFSNSAHFLLLSTTLIQGDGGTLVGQLEAKQFPKDQPPLFELLDTDDYMV
jgi:hypothetical protein